TPVLGADRRTRAGLRLVSPPRIPNLRWSPGLHILSMYRLDTSGRYSGGVAEPSKAGGASRDEPEDRRARACRARVAARNPHAWLRVAQAAELGSRGVPRLRLRIAVSVPEGPHHPRPDRRGHAARSGQTAGRPSFQDRLPADRRWQGVPAGPARPGRTGLLGGRRVRGQVRLL